MEDNSLAGLGKKGVWMITMEDNSLAGLGEERDMDDNNGRQQPGNSLGEERGMDDNNGR